MVSNDRARPRRAREHCKIQLSSMRAIIERAVALSRAVNHPENIRLRVRLLLHIEKFAVVCAIAQSRERLSPNGNESMYFLFAERERKTMVNF